MDPARAAAMSDPKRNPWFRRRWVDVEASQQLAGPGVPPAVQIEQTGHDLLALWRQARDQARRAASE